MLISYHCLPSLKNIWDDVSAHVLCVLQPNNPTTKGKKKSIMPCCNTTYSNYSPLSMRVALQKYHLTSSPSEGLFVRARYFCRPLQCSITSSNLEMFEGVFFNKSGEMSSTLPKPVASETMSLTSFLGIPLLMSSVFAIVIILKQLHTDQTR